MFDGEEALLGKIEAVEAVAWQQGKPVWRNISKKRTGNPGITMGLDLHIEDDPGGVLDGYGGLPPKAEALVEGASVRMISSEQLGCQTRTREGTPR